jgi:hypothetical protein
MAMGLLDDAIREHLDLKRRRGADPAEVERAEREALGPVRRSPDAEHEPFLDHDPRLHDGQVLHDGTAFDHEPASGYTVEESSAAYTNGAGWDESAGTAPAELDDPWAPAGGQPELPPQAPAGSFEDDDPFESDDPFEDEDPLDDDEEHGPEDDEGEEDYDAESSAARDIVSPTFEPTPSASAAPPPVAPPPVAATPPPIDRDPPRQPPRLSENLLGETIEYDVEESFADEEGDDEDVLEETPEFLQDAPEHDRLWFEQRPPRDFDFDG